MSEENPWITDHLSLDADPVLLDQITALKKNIVGQLTGEIAAKYYRFVGSVIDQAMQAIQKNPEDVRKTLDYVESACDYGGDLVKGKKLGEGFDPQKSSIESLLTVEKFNEFYESTNL